jgi:hypothetical protein
MDFFPEQMFEKSFIGKPPFRSFFPFSLSKTCRIPGIIIALLV